jgi:hypothetical protein
MNKPIFVPNEPNVFRADHSISNEVTCAYLSEAV